MTFEPCCKMELNIMRILLTEKYLLVCCSELIYCMHDALTWHECDLEGGGGGE
jgi:hypothetical protein